MKKYLIADALTLLEVLCAIALAYMGLFNCPVDYAIWIFATGIICDALDGPCARTWHYPKDGKRRWWREKAELTDQISDLMLGIAGFIYIGCCINVKLGQYGFIAAFVIGCLVQVIVYPSWGGIECLNLQASHPGLALALICTRRILYAIGLILGVFTMIQATSWSKSFKITTVAILVIGALIALKLKRNRLNTDKTPL